MNLLERDWVGEGTRHHIWEVFLGSENSFSAEDLEAMY